MAEQREQKPGTGIDRTVIRTLLALTPAQRAKVMVESAKNVAKVLDLHVAVCALDDLLRMKRAADRPKDRVELEILAALKEERENL
jgi:hypothetical protein